MNFDKWILTCLGACLVLCLHQSSLARPWGSGLQVLGDSIGTETRNGQLFVLYRVEPQETLYGIATKYKISVAELVKHNPQTETGLKVGDVLAIPYLTQPQGLKYHTVEKSETLYSISRLYNVSVEELMRWNSLSSSAINIGDRLQIAAGVASENPQEKGNKPLAADSSSASAPDYTGKIVHNVKAQETLYSLARMYDTTVDNLKEWNTLESDILNVGQRLIVGISNVLPSANERILRADAGGERKREHAYNKDPMSISQIGNPSQEELVEEAPQLDADGVRKISELGMATGISDSLNTQKYLALHRTAPVGTIMQVHNEMNNLSVFVRIVGKLPDTGNNDKVIIKLSKKAFDKLGAYGDKFPVRLSYIP
jgi:LysM repeat protein